MKNAAIKIQKFEPVQAGGEEKLTRSEVVLTTAKRALRILNQKEMAARVGVSESQISQWLNGVKDIPQPRQIEILKQAKFFLREQRTIEDQIDALMLMQFGRAE